MASTFWIMWNRHLYRDLPLVWNMRGQSESKWCRGQVSRLFAGRVFHLRLRTSLAATTIENPAHRWQSTTLTCVSSQGWLVNMNAVINERKALECKCAYSCFSDSHSREETLGTVTWSTLIRPGRAGSTDKRNGIQGPEAPYPLILWCSSCSGFWGYLW